MAASDIAIQPRIVLLVENNPGEARLVKRALASVVDDHYSVEHVTQLSAALERIGRGGIDVALVSLPDAGGLETFQALSAAAQSLPVVVLTGLNDEYLAIALLQHGAQDYLLKHEIEPKLLARSIRYAIERSRATALKSLNEQLEHAMSSLTKAVSELERTNEDLAQFTYFASHDLQEPVRKINYFAGQLQENIGDKLNDDARQDFYFILDAGRRMQALVQSLLALSKAGNAEMEWGRVDLNCCVSDALECHAAQIEATRAVIVRTSLPVVSGDATLLNHLYQNLIGNALKFTNGGHPRIRLTANARDTQWLLGVRDNGIGIKPEFAQSVFAPFQQLNGRQRYEGMGIGLAICRKVVDRHGGRIWVESKLGAGAQFKFLLPRKQTNRPTNSIPRPQRLETLCPR